MNNEFIRELNLAYTLSLHYYMINSIMYAVKTPAYRPTNIQYQYHVIEYCAAHVAPMRLWPVRYALVEVDATARACDCELCIGLIGK